MGGIGKSDGTESGSEGDDNRPGDKGNPEGNPYAPYILRRLQALGMEVKVMVLRGRSLANKG